MSSRLEPHGNAIVDLVTRYHRPPDVDPLLSLINRDWWTSRRLPSFTLWTRRRRRRHCRVAVDFIVAFASHLADSRPIFTSPEFGTCRSESPPWSIASTIPIFRYRYDEGSEIRKSSEYRIFTVLRRPAF